MSITFSNPRLLFFQFADYFDADGYQFGYNFKCFANALYSLTINNFLGDNFVDLVMGLMDGHMVLMCYWLMISFLNKFMLANFVCGILYNCYNALFDKDKAYMRRPQFNKIRHSIKREIANENLKGPVFANIMKNYTQQGDFDTVNDQIEEFYSRNARNQFRTQYGLENPDNVGCLFNLIRVGKPYIYTLGLLEGSTYILIIITFEIEVESTYWLLVLILFVNLLLIMDRFMFLLNNYSDSQTTFRYVDILASLVIFGLGFQCLARPEEFYYSQLMSKNRGYLKWLCVLFVIKSARFLRLFRFNKQISMVTKVIFDSFAFLTDILGIIVIFFFLFGSLGMSMFGGNVNSATPAQFEAIYGDEPDELLMMMNFNDYYYSILTLFTVMMGGWTSTVALNTAAFGTEHNSMAYNVFFLIYFFFVNLCFLNTLFGFLVDNVSANLEVAMEEEEAQNEGKEVEEPAEESQHDSKSESSKENICLELDRFLDLKSNSSQGGGSGLDESGHGFNIGDSNFEYKGEYDPVRRAVQKIPV